MKGVGHCTSWSKKVVNPNDSGAYGGEGERVECEVSW